MASNNCDEAGIDFGTLHELTGYWIRRAQLNTFRQINECFAEFDITPGLFGALEIVQRNPGLTQTAVAAAMGNDRSAMVAIVDKLEKRGLLVRQPAPNDRRSNALYLTEQGEAFQQQVRNRALDHNQRFFSFLTVEQHQQLFDMLRLVAETDYPQD
ncbi:MarR family winged helix-turn-helix transcriptional regulator [Marinobacterium litorale]|uniref:MarR family winged helix-turn-helix transcriptional regulator n=1 Tax=Marinobacterium litorale TaxID=404770 RepID=UPI0004188B95|nr:MarR family transcriptional regulator [Marinobacterium litorale]